MPYRGIRQGLSWLLVLVLIAVMLPSLAVFPLGSSRNLFADEGQIIEESSFRSAFEVEWYKTFGGTSGDYAHSVRQTIDGGYIITGGTESYGAGFYDIWLIKTDACGNEQWNKTFGGSDYDSSGAVSQTSDGGYIIIGNTESYGAGSSDVWLIKIDASGNEQWNKTFGGSDYDYGSSVYQTLDGGYIITGGTRTYGAGSCDIWLIKADASGNEQWSKTFGGRHDDSAGSVSQTPDGGYIITGSTSSYGAGSDDVWLVKTDANGNEQWNKTFGGTDIDYGFSWCQTSDDGCIIAGSTRSYGAGSDDFWLIKTDTSGDEQWNKTFGGADEEKGFSVCQTPDGGYIIAGRTRSFGAGFSDGWLVKTDANGNEEWNKPLGGAREDESYSVCLTSDGGYIVAGNTLSYSDGSTPDVWLIKMSRAYPVVEIESITIAAGRSGSVDIWVRNYPDVPDETPYGLGFYNIRIDFDPTAVHIDMVSDGDSPFDTQISSVFDDHVEIGQTSTAWPGPSGDIRICGLEFTCLGAGETTLVLTVNELNNVNGEPVEHVTYDSTITQIPRGITIAPISGVIGTEVTVTGAGFTVSEMGITVTWDGTVVITGITANPDGFWGPEAFNVPLDASIGEHIVDAYGATVNAEEVPDVIFTVMASYKLTVGSTDGGSVAQPGEGTFIYDTGALVDLVAISEDGYVFANWTGDTDTVAYINAACTTIIMDSDKDITANFVNDVVVTFPDSNLESAIRQAIRKPTGEIFQSDIEALTELFARGRNISDLTGLEYSINLTTLDLPANQISDILPLANLISLTYLDLEVNQISNVLPLANLINLTYLDLRGNQIVDISPLANLTSLTNLGLGGNQISDISPLANLTSMTRLWLGGNQISDISSLANLTSLTNLGLADNQISVISPLSNLTSLKALHLSGNQIGDISPLANLTRLTYLYLGSNQISDISSMANLTSLIHLYLVSNLIEDVSPLANLTSLAHLYLESNRISNVLPLASLTGLTELWLPNNQISDISPLSNLACLDYLCLSDNRIGDVSPLANLTNLIYLHLDSNQISDIEPLVDNAGLGALDIIYIRGNPLSTISLSTYIPQLQQRGVIVNYQTQLEVETSLGDAQDLDRVVVIPVAIARVKNRVTHDTVVGVKISDYAANMTFTPGFMEILNISGGDSPFDTIPPENIVIDNFDGKAYISHNISPDGASPPRVVFRIVARLTGSALVGSDLTVNIAWVSDPAGEIMNAQAQPMVLTIQRGDIDSNGEVNIIDAMAGAQYLVWPPELEPQINHLNMASVKPDGAAGDKKDIIDCMFIAQYVVGIRDEYFGLVP